MVKGKLELAAGGAVVDLARIDILRVAEIDPQASASAQADDVADWIRTAAATPDGSFAVAVTVPGQYNLRARWGHGIASRAFTMKDPPEDVDLGTLVLQNAASVRGLVHDCSGGELILAPMPDLAHPTRLAFADLRRVPLGNDGRFFVDAIFAGSWFLGATCNAQRTLLEPGIINVTDGQNLVLELHPTTREPKPPPTQTQQP